MSQTTTTELLVSGLYETSQRIYELLIYGYIRNTQCMITSIIPNDIIITIFSIYQNIPKRYGLYNLPKHYQSIQGQKFRIDAISIYPHPQHYMHHIMTPENPQKLAKQLRGCLNKLIPQNYDKIANNMMDIVYAFADTKEQMNVIIELILTFAIKQPFVTQYVQLCNHIQAHLANVAVICEYKWMNNNNDLLITFKKMIIMQANSLFNKYRQHSSEEGIKTTKDKDMFFAMMTLIAELYNAEIFRKCVVCKGVFEVLLPPRNTKLSGIDIEGMCGLLKRCGKKLDIKGKKYVDKYLEKLKLHAPRFDFRTRMLVDEINEMRLNQWILPRKVIGCGGYHIYNYNVVNDPDTTRRANR